MIIDKLKRTGDDCVFISLQDLNDLKEYAKQFSLNKLKVSSLNIGQRSCRLLARGMEFAETRRYLPGDDVRNIDWRVTARTGKAHTKLFVEERESKVIIAVDMRSSMFFATQGVFKSVQAALLTGYLSWNAVHKGKLLGGLVFDDQKIAEFKPSLLKKSIFPFFKGVADRFENREVVSSDEKTVEAALQNLARLATSGSLVFLISDFRKYSAFAKELLVQISKKADLRLCFLYDPMEADLPKNGYYPVTNGNFFAQLNTHHKMSLEKYRKNFSLRRNNIVELEAEGRIHFMECATDDDCLKFLQKHF